MPALFLYTVPLLQNEGCIIKVMLFLSLVHDYFVWHYSRAYREIFSVWLNLMWFVIHFFSIPLLLRSWFSPYKRITEERKRSLNFEDLVGYIVINLMSRIVGAMLRSFLIIIGLVLLCVIAIVGLAVHVLWIFLPLLLVTGLVIGVSLLFM
jgi:hypothetical protein